MMQGTKWHEQRFRILPPVGFGLFGPLYVGSRTNGPGPGSYGAAKTVHRGHHPNTFNTDTPVIIVGDNLSNDSSFVDRINEQIEAGYMPVGGPYTRQNGSRLLMIKTDGVSLHTEMMAVCYATMIDKIAELEAKIVELTETEAG